MRIRNFIVVLVTVCILKSASLSAQNGDSSVTLDVSSSKISNLQKNMVESVNDDSFYDRWISGKLSIGMSYSVFSLSAGERPANREDDFIGNVNLLLDNNEQNFIPTISYQLCDYLLIGASYCQIEARTMNFNNYLSDGNAILKGPVFTIELSYPLLKKRIIPHAGLGVAILKGDFEEDTWWRLGYSSPESWDYYSRPTSKTRTGYYRYIDVEDASSNFFSVGIAFRPISHMQFDVSYRKLSLNPNCEFGYDYSPSKGEKDKHHDGDFDMSGGCWLLSLSYVF